MTSPRGRRTTTRRKKATGEETPPATPPTADAASENETLVDSYVEPTAPLRVQPLMGAQVEPGVEPPMFEDPGSRDVEQQIRERAYELYLQRGDLPGDELSDWLQAEREYRSRGIPQADGETIDIREPARD